MAYTLTVCTVKLLLLLLNVKSGPRMHQNPPVSGKNSIFSWGGGIQPPSQTPPPLAPRPSAPHYKILDPPLAIPIHIAYLYV